MRVWDDVQEGRREPGVLYGVMDLVHRADAKGAPFLQEAVTKMELDFQSCPTTSGTCGITIRPLRGCS